MATFLDIGLLGHFSIIFPFLLVFIVTYALLHKYKFVSEEKGVNALIAFAVACLTLFSKAATTLIFLVSPWFVIIFLFILFVLLAFRFMGTKADVIEDVMSKDFGPIHWVMIVVVALIALSAIGAIFGPGLLGEEGAQTVTTTSTIGPENVALTANQTATAGQFQANVKNVLFHPKILGIAALLLIAVFAIRGLVYVKPTKK